MYSVVESIFVKRNIFIGVVTRVLWGHNSNTHFQFYSESLLPDFRDPTIEIIELRIYTKLFEAL